MNDGNKTRTGKNSVKKMVAAGLMLAMAMFLPLLTGQIPSIGSKISPMHIPVLLAGFICGWPYGMLVGVIAPALRFLLFGMPPIFPTGLAMTFELAAYGFFAGFLYEKLPRKGIYVYVTLILSMLAGRVVWGIAMYLISLFSSAVTFSLGAFWAGAFASAVPGIIVHIALIPPIVVALKKAGLVFHE